MLLKINYVSGEKSVYRCDMCNKNMNPDNKITLQERQASNTKKKWDLCKHCYQILEKAIEKRREKNK